MAFAKPRIDEPIRGVLARGGKSSAMPAGASWRLGVSFISSALPPPMEPVDDAELRASSVEVAVASSLAGGGHGTPSMYDLAIISFVGWWMRCGRGSCAGRDGGGFGTNAGGCGSFLGVGSASCGSLIGCCFAKDAAGGSSFLLA